MVTDDIMAETVLRAKWIPIVDITCDPIGANAKTILFYSVHENSLFH